MRWHPVPYWLYRHTVCAAKAYAVKIHLTVLFGFQTR